MFADISHCDLLDIQTYLSYYNLSDLQIYHTIKTYGFVIPINHTIGLSDMWTRHTINTT